jgi:predicted nucleotide-binding protein
MFEFLKDLDLRPQEWSQLVAATEHGSPYVGQVLDKAMEHVQAVLVFLTPDDVVHLRDDLATKPADLVEQHQPRPNVLFEAGLAFGFHPTRTILVEYGDLRGLSDLFGRHAVRLDNGVSALEDLANRLRTAGCEVETSSSTWRDTARFPVRKSSSDRSTGEEG